MEENYNDIVQAQRNFFATGATLSLAFRQEQLRKLAYMIKTNQAAIAAALAKDLRKPPMEAFFSEIYLVLDEIDLMLKKIKRWAKPLKVATPFPLGWPGRSYVYSEPYGCVLILAPWNYPFSLLFSPLIGAISAGNCVLIKPSEISTHLQNLILRLVNETFSSDYLFALKAGPEQTEELLKVRFDYIFFTGGTRIGKIIMAAAARYLTPVTLELGGKSPCIVDATANLDFAARRIVWGKFLNVGQTCIAPDFLYVHESCKSELINKIRHVVKQFYGDSPNTSDSYGRIINQKHFQHLQRLMQKGTILFGGETNEAELYIAPTCIDDVSMQDPIMQEEIFGPLLPILTFTDTNELIATLKKLEKPLALYVFSKDKVFQKKILTEISFGGGCINDCLLQIANFHLPFGGVGESGLGRYHGKYSFETFSHQKGIYKKSKLIDFSFQYPPYTKFKFWLFKLLLRIGRIF